MTYACLDDGFHDDPRIVEAGLAAAGLYACLTCYCSRHLTDGDIPRRAALRMLDGGDMAPIEALLEVGMVVVADGDRYRLPEYFNHGNQTRETVNTRRENAKAAANARHHGERQRKSSTRGATPADADPDIPF